MSQINVRGSIASPATITRLRTRISGQKLSPYLFLLPGLILFGMFILWPMLYSLRVSFYNWNVVRTDLSAFVGLENYRATLSDQIFQRAVVNTVTYVLVTVPGQGVG